MKPTYLFTIQFDRNISDISHNNDMGHSGIYGGGKNLHCWDFHTDNINIYKISPQIQGTIEEWDET